jgi:hypothetical protein
VTSGKLSNLADPLFPHWCKKGNNSYLTGFLRGLHEITVSGSWHIVCAQYASLPFLPITSLFPEALTPCLRAVAATLAPLPLDTVPGRGILPAGDFKGVWEGETDFLIDWRSPLALTMLLAWVTEET